MKKINNTILNIVITSIFIIELVISIIMQKDIATLINLIILLIMFTVLLFKSDFLLIVTTLGIALISDYLYFNIGLGKISYLLVDYFVAIIFIKLIIKCVSTKKKLKKEIIIILSFVLIGIISAILNGVKAKLFVQNFYMDYIRYFIVFLYIQFSSIGKNEIKKIVKFLIIFTLIQLPFVIYQSIYLNIFPGDMGTSTQGFVLRDFYSGIIGGKGTTELGFLIVLIISFLYSFYSNKGIKFKTFVICTSVMLIISVVNETKVTFVLVPIALIILNIRKIGIKNIVLTVLICSLVVVAINKLEELYPSQQGALTNIETMKEYINSDYAGSGLSRINGSAIATKEISKDLYSFFIGNGPGSGDKSINGKYKFRTFFFPYLIYELGSIEFLLFVYLIFLCIKKSFYLSKSRDHFLKSVGDLGIITCFLVFFSGVYSISMAKANFAMVVWIINSIILKMYYKSVEV